MVVDLDVMRLEGFAPAERHVYRTGIYNTLPLQRSGNTLVGNSKLIRGGI